MSKKLRVHLTSITTNPILIYLELNKQYYLFIDSSKHSWSGILYSSQNRQKTMDLKLKFHTQLLIKVEHSKVSKEWVHSH